MKIKYIPFIFLVSCAEKTPQEQSSKDSLIYSTGQNNIPDQNLSQNDSLNNANPDSLLQGKPIAFYLQDKSISQFAKDHFLGKLKPIDDSTTFFVFDSLEAKVSYARPFYFLVTTKIFYKADGAVSEMAGSIARDYLENHPKEFSNYFIKEKMLTKNDFNKWADQVKGEIVIGNEGYELEELKVLAKTIRTNCKNCDDEKKKKLDEFLTAVRNYLPTSR